MADGSDSGDDEEGGEASARTRSRRWMHIRRVSLAGIDKAVAEKVIAEHDGLVIHLAHQYDRQIPNRSHGPITFDDLVAIGRVVLLQSYLEYDASRGTKFSTWAALTLRQTFTHLVRETYARTSVRDRRNFPTPFSFEELAESLVNSHFGRFDDARDAALYRLSQSSIDHDPGLDEHVEDRRRLEWLRVQVRRLSAREREVLFAVLGEQNKAELSTRFGVTRQRIEQIYASALAKLRAAAESAGLFDEGEDGRDPRRLLLEAIQHLPLRGEELTLGAA